MDYGELALKGIRHLPKAGPRVLVPVVVTAIGAAVAATKGALDLHDSQETRQSAEQRYAKAQDKLKKAETHTEATAKAYGDFQTVVQLRVVGRFADWLEANEHQVRRLRFQRVDGVRVSIPKIPKYVADVRNVSAGLTTAVTAVGAGAAAPAAALWGVAQFGTAGTGAAIAGLQGIAATNATLAVLGGGTLAAGGGGMAAGAAVLGVAAVVPAALVGGFGLGVAGARANMKAAKYSAAVNADIARMELAHTLLAGIEARISELTKLLDQLHARAVEALDVLESVEFNSDLHASEFLRAYQLVTAVKEVLNAPVLDPKTGQLSDASVEFLRRYA